MTSISGPICIIIFCLVMSAYFSATETAFTSLNRIRMKTKADNGDRKAQLVCHLADHFDWILSTILIGNNIVNITCASVATILFVNLFGNDLGASLSTIVTTIVVLIFGEISPKSIAKESPEQMAMRNAPLLKILAVLLAPINFLFQQWKKVLSTVFHTSQQEGVSQAELLSMVDEACKEGGINRDEGILIRSAIQFDKLAVEDILTPRIDVVGVEQNMNMEQVERILEESGYSRLPVYRESMDQIVGILYQKDFYKALCHGCTEISSIMRQAFFVTKNLTLNDLRKEFQSQKLQIAVILDEFGGTVGIVTMEDILEELVGEIWDEHDVVVEEMSQIEDGSYQISGKANVAKVFDYLKMPVQEFEDLTFGGWVMSMLGQIPKTGDQISYGGYTITVMTMNRKRVEMFKIESIQRQSA